jgi:hypothetical protein
MALLVTKPGVRYVGVRRLGAWLSAGVCEEHRVRCSGISCGPRFVELSVRGRSAGLCW